MLAVNTTTDAAVTATPTSDPRTRGGGITHIVYMYITCFGIISIVLILTIILRCIRKLQKKAKLAKPTIYRNRSTQGQQLVTQELDEFQSSDKARLV
ncbi:hypothetical protein HOLleu_12490 [Holothuria leucospilota]|uniref:Uncharacterized protein n=1 Tax=Holothuria leucospilota TaxID=206669 RepID=A0A9Q1CAY4_HOLLE|nr:hypothetical protein HOLleu_12490 [Holothuria leucospilota]